MLYVLTQRRALPAECNVPLIAVGVVISLSPLSYPAPFGYYSWSIRRIELINNIGPCPKLHVATSPRRDFSSIVANSSLYIRYIHPISIVRNFSHQFLQFSFTFDTKTIPLPCLYILFQIIFPNNFYLLFLGEKSARKKAKKKKNSSIREFECTLKGKSITYISPIYKLSGLSRNQSFSNREAEPIHLYEADNRSTGQDLPTLESKCLQGKMRDSSRSKSRTTTTTTTATSLANRTKRSLHVLTALIDKITGTEYRF